MHPTWSRHGNGIIQGFLRPSPLIETSHSVVVHSLSGYSSLDYYSILALRLLLHRGFKLLMSCWIRAHRPNTTVTCMVPRLFQFPVVPKMLHQLSRLLMRHLPRRMRYKPWGRLLRGLALIEVVPNHLKLLMEHCLPHPRLIRRWFSCLWWVKGWTHKTFNSMRSKINWPTSFRGSMLKAFQAFFLQLLLMLSFFVSFYVHLLIWMFIFCLPLIS